MKKLFSIFFILLSCSCANKNHKYVGFPDELKITKEENELLSRKEKSALSTYGTYYGYSYHPSVTTKLVVKETDLSGNKSNTNAVTCLFQYDNNCRCLDANYQLNFALDIINPEKFKKGQQINLPHKNIKIRVEQYTEGDMAYLQAIQPVKGIIKFEEIEKTKIVVSVFFRIEDNSPYGHKEQRNSSILIDYASLEFIPEKLEKYASDYSSFSVHNQDAKKLLFSSYPKGNLHLSDSYYRDKKPTQLKRIQQIRNLIGDPKFPGGLDSLNNHFKKNLPCPEGILKGAKPNTLFIYLEIDRDGKVFGGEIGTTRAFGNPSPFTEVGDLNTDDPQLERDLALLVYKKKLNALIYNLPAFKVPNTLGINKQEIEHYTYVFPILFNCDNK